MKHIKPGRGPSAMGALGSVIAVVFGIFWSVSVASMGAPISFSIFGVLFVIVGIVQAVYNFKNAAGKKRYSAFDIVDGGSGLRLLLQKAGRRGGAGPAESALRRPAPGGRGHVRTGGAPALLPLLRRQAGGFLYILRPLRQAAA